MAATRRPALQISLSDEIRTVVAVGTEEIKGLWTFYTQNKDVVEKGRRNENLFWRVWAAERIGRPLSGSKVASLFDTIRLGEEAFDKSRYRIPPLKFPKDPLTPPPSPLSLSPPGSLPSQSLVAQLIQQALGQAETDPSSPLPPRVPPPSPETATSPILAAIGKSEQSERRGKHADPIGVPAKDQVLSQNKPAPMKSALKKAPPSVTSANPTTLRNAAPQTNPSATATGKPKKKAIFQIGPGPAEDDESSRSDTDISEPRSPEESPTKKPKKQVTVRKPVLKRKVTPTLRTRAAGIRPRVAKQNSTTALLRGRRQEGQIKEEQENLRQRSSSAHSHNERRRGSSSEEDEAGPSREGRSGDWIVDPNFRLKFTQRKELESRNLAKAAPSTVLLRETVIRKPPALGSKASAAITATQAPPSGQVVKEVTMVYSDKDKAPLYTETIKALDGETPAGDIDADLKELPAMPPIGKQKKSQLSLLFEEERKSSRLRGPGRTGMRG